MNALSLAQVLQIFFVENHDVVGAYPLWEAMQRCVRERTRVDAHTKEQPPARETTHSRENAVSLCTNK